MSQWSLKCTCEKCGRTFTYPQKIFCLVDNKLICADCFNGRETRFEPFEHKIRFFTNNVGLIQFSSRLK